MVYKRHRKCGGDHDEQTTSAHVSEKTEQHTPAEHLQRQIGNRAMGDLLDAPEAAPPIVHDVLRSPGQPLDAATRTLMESRFGQAARPRQSGAVTPSGQLTVNPPGDAFEQDAERMSQQVMNSPAANDRGATPDFSSVQIHTGDRAAAASQAVNAQAFTAGNHIVFDEGNYAPQTRAGQELIAHELTHTLQQGGEATAIQRQENVTEMEPLDVTPSRRRRERIIREAGWKQRDVIITVTDWRGQPMGNHRVFAEFKAPGVSDQIEAGDIQGGSISFSGVWLKPVGTVRIMTVPLITEAQIEAGESAAGQQASGVTTYSLPAEGPLIFNAQQGNREVTVTATSSEEAAQEVGVTGSAGVNFEVVSLGSEVSASQQRTRGRSTSLQWKVIIPTASLSIQQQSSSAP